MIVPLPPLTFACRACRWKYTLPFQTGDCLLPGFNCFDHCPRCGGEVESRRAGPLELLAARVSWTLGRHGGHRR